MYSFKTLACFLCSAILLGRFSYIKSNDLSLPCKVVHVDGTNFYNQADDTMIVDSTWIHDDQVNKVDCEAGFRTEQGQYYAWAWCKDGVWRYWGDSRQYHIPERINSLQCFAETNSETSVLDRTSKLLTEMKAIRNEILLDEEGDTQLEVHIAKLFEDLTIIIGQFASVKAQLSYQITDLEEEISTLTTRLGNSELTNSGLKQMVTNIEIRQTSMELNIEGLEKNISNAFAVGLGTSQKITGNIKYDFIRYNPDNHYDASTGIYTAPSSGVYYFLIHVYTLGYGFAYLTQNGNTRCAAYTPTQDKIHGTNSVIVHANKGDRFYVKSGSSDLHFYGFGASWSYNSFMGMRLF